jgi:TonB family protein
MFAAPSDTPPFHFRSKMIRRALTILALAAALPAALHAQKSASRPEQPCRVIPDTAIVPSAQQVREREELRAALDSVARAHGVAAPAGILFVDADSTRHGKVFFIDSNLPQPASAAATRRVAEYLSTLEPGRAYQALVRIDGAYAAPAPGKRNCTPVLANGDSLSAMMLRVLDRHPESGTRAEPVVKRAVVRLVVNRDGGVSYAEVVQPTGDTAIDPYPEEIARRLRFLPARLDDVPYDVRFRFSLQFNVR